jgi:hypothetical protein
MKQQSRISLIMIFMVIFTNFTFSQVSPSDPQYQSMKERGLIAQPEQVIPVEPIPAITPTDPGTRDFTLKVPLDGTFTLAMGPNDDGSTGLLSLPFTFCFYGDDFTTFYINNNGNVSFGNPYGTFTPTGFPIAAFPMLAPFWADVDTRPDLGEVWYKIDAVNNRVVVIWNNTGYFFQHGDLRNTFELIFTDGNDPLIGIGNNVAFSYTTMQWTTGDASGGSGGFGGSPATVGVNKGDGVKYALVGRFDQPGTTFDGPGGANDGVGYLEGKYYQFNACEEDVVIPGEVPVSNWALIIGIGLILAFTVIRFRKMV